MRPFLKRIHLVRNIRVRPIEQNGIQNGSILNIRIPLLHARPFPLARPPRSTLHSIGAHKKRTPILQRRIHRIAQPLLGLYGVRLYLHDEKFWMDHRIERYPLFRPSRRHSALYVRGTGHGIGAYKRHGAHVERRIHESYSQFAQY